MIGIGVGNSKKRHNQDVYRIFAYKAKAATLHEQPKSHLCSTNRTTAA